MIIEELKTYKGREIRIKTLEQERIVFAYDENRRLKVEQQLKELKFQQSKLNEFCVLLTAVEYEIIFNIYMNVDYRFETLLKASLDLHFTYSALRAYKKSALEKLESLEKGLNISIKI